MRFVGLLDHLGRVALMVLAEGTEFVRGYQIGRVSGPFPYQVSAQSRGELVGVGFPPNWARLTPALDHYLR